MPRFPRVILALLLATVLLTAAAPARPLPGAGSRQPAAAPSAPLDLLGRLWSFLTGFRSKNGCGLDPNGTTPTSENGCGADPNGRCLSDSTPDTAENGCGLDPSGRCGE